MTSLEYGFDEDQIERERGAIERQNNCSMLEGEEFKNLCFLHESTSWRHKNEKSILSFVSRFRNFGENVLCANLLVPRTEFDQCCVFEHSYTARVYCEIFQANNKLFKHMREDICASPQSRIRYWVYSSHLKTRESKWADMLGMYGGDRVKGEREKERSMEERIMIEEEWWPHAEIKSADKPYLYVPKQSFTNVWKVLGSLIHDTPFLQ